MVRDYPDFDGMLRKAARKWAEANRLTFQDISYADPLTNSDTISLNVKFKDIGCPEECVELERISVSQAFTNNTGQQQKETFKTTTYVEDEYTWENDYHFVLPGQNFLIMPRLPRSAHRDINPGFLVNFFGENQQFHTKMRELRPIEGEVFLEPSSSATIQLQVEKQYISQPYEIELSILGSIIVIARDRQNRSSENYVRLTDLMPLLCPCKNFSCRGRALVFVEQGTFKGVLSRAIRAYVTQTLHKDGKMLEYEIPLNASPEREREFSPQPLAARCISDEESNVNPSILSSRPSNPTAYSQQPMTTNSTSCGCSSCMSEKSNSNLYINQ
ncbi:hypothetical protein [Bacillus toyonensis]|uniref:hypothetical protein n=1 Tax=Bacillus toyonensis TaxID=155322 RepID=UPI0001ED26F8|nr:hypothetical protein [Bacillus toyonensis]MED3202113.1 hypothetical protein [Bacillus toyonensis]OTX08894.1 hypothetical protein BK712_07810 [Bacillus thuringiensis serovar seoulensis]